MTGFHETPQTGVEMTGSFRNALLAALLVGCTSDTASSPADAPDGGDAGDVEAEGAPPEPLTLRVVTFNTGTGVELDHDSDGDAYGATQAAYTDEWYGNGLAWKSFVETTRAWFQDTAPDIVGFQEIFWAGECPGIPAEAQTGFICEDWVEGDPTVAQLVLGPGQYQVACHKNNPDKCLAVRRDFGTFRGCDSDICLDGLDGFRVDTCGKSSRVGRGVIELAGGGELTVVNFHGSSGFKADDLACRTKQVDQVFVDLGDGEPGANGARNIIMGDFNTDPARLAGADPSADRWNDFVGDGKAFHFVSDVGTDVPPTYVVLGNIDHVVSDAFDGSCWAAGVTEGHPPVLDVVFFDHRPVVCDLTEEPK